VRAGRVLVLHGAGVDHREAEACFEPALAVHGGLRRIYPDLPGMGRTPAPTTLRSADDVLGVLLGFLDEVAGPEPVPLVGHSVGAYYCHGLATRRPDRVAGLALVCPLLAGVRDVPEHRPVVAANGPLCSAADGVRWDGRAMMRRPTLFLTVGLPCTGKTTAARRIEIEQNALRLTKDEWVKALYGHENPTSAGDVIEGRLIQIGLRALEIGNNVVIDFGLWSRDERSALRQAAADLGAMVELRYFELAANEQRRRLEQRQAEAPQTTWPVSDDELAEWAANFDIPTPGELDGSEPIDDPPAGFATWDEWRSHRWPPRVT
jgi:Predicted kinase